MKKISYILCFLVFFSFLIISVSAHGGKTDSNGGHNSSSGYHYHHGYPAHSHYDMNGDGKIDCPYDFDDKTDHSSKSNVDKTNGEEIKEEDTDFGSISLSVMLDISTFLISIGLCVAVVFPIMFAVLEKTNIQIGCFTLLMLSYVITYLLLSLIISLSIFFRT